MWCGTFFKREHTSLNDIFCNNTPNITPQITKSTWKSFYSLCHFKMANLKIDCTLMFYLTKYLIGVLKLFCGFINDLDQLSLPQTTVLMV